MRPASFKIEVPGDNDVKEKLLHKLQQVRRIMNGNRSRPVNNGDILEHVLDAWLQNNGSTNKKKGTEDNYRQKTTTDLSPDKCTPDMYIISQDALKNLLGVAQSHSQQCTDTLTFTKIHYIGHVAVCKLKCRQQKHHQYWWSSSPKLPNQKYLVNERVGHAVFCSGMLPVSYERFSKGAGIGCISTRRRNAQFQDYRQSIHEEYTDSVEMALQLEMGMYNIDDTWQGIDVASDARHGWRKNAKDTSVVVIGDQSHRVLQHIHITKADDHCTQRHEKLGTERMYEYFEQKGVSVRTHAHDRNMSINKYVRDNQVLTTNQNDPWHCIKSLKTAVKGIGSGPQYLRGKTWHSQLEDKWEPVATHAYWAIKHCNQDPEFLQQILLNTVDHYKNNHTGCDSGSRCRRDPKYEPSRKVISDPTAEKLLHNVIEKSTLYLSAEDYALGKETYFVESFNNVMNIFHDKRIAFGDAQYLARSEIAVCHWNENVLYGGQRSILGHQEAKRGRKIIRGAPILMSATFGTDISCLCTLNHNHDFMIQG
jgi:hypothetical protein